MLRLLGLWLMAMLVMAAPVTAAGITVTVNAEATVPGPLMTLGEMAVVTGDDSEKVKALEGAKLGAAPSPGHRLMLTSDIVMTRLSAAGLDLSDVTWQMPPAIVVATAAQTVSGERLATAAAEALRRQLGDEGTTTVSLIGTPADVQVPLGRVELKADTPSGIRFNVPTTAVVTVVVDGRPTVNASLKFNVKAYQQVVVAARNIAARETITAGSVRLERREVGRMAGYMTDPDKVVGQTARQPITAGTPLQEAGVDKPVLIKRGATVTIVAKSGEMTITAGGQVLQDGRQGEIVRVQNTLSKRIFSARVVDAATVEVIIYGGR